jgi:hypothetical protein
MNEWMKDLLPTKDYHPQQCDTVWFCIHTFLQNNSTFITALSLWKTWKPHLSHIYISTKIDFQTSVIKMNRIKITSMFPTPASGNSIHMNKIYRILCSLVCNENTIAEAAWKTSVNTWVHVVNRTKHTPSEIQANQFEFL